MPVIHSWRNFSKKFIDGVQVQHFKSRIAQLLLELLLVGLGYHCPFHSEGGMLARRGEASSYILPSRALFVWIRTYIMCVCDSRWFQSFQFKSRKLTLIWLQGARKTEKIFTGRLEVLFIRRVSPSVLVTNNYFRVNYNREHNKYTRVLITRNSCNTTLKLDLIYS